MKADDPFKSLLARIDESMRPYRSIQKQIDTILEPQRSFQAYVDSVFRQYQDIQARLAQYVEPVRRLQEVIGRDLAPYQAIQERMDEYLNVHTTLQGQIDQYLAPQRWIHDQLATYIPPHLEMLQRIEAELAVPQFAAEEVARALESLNQYLLHVRESAISVDAYGRVSVAGEAIAAEEIGTAAQELLGQQKTRSGFLAELLDWLARLRKPLRIVVLHVLAPYLLAVVANLTTPIYEEWWSVLRELDQQGPGQQTVKEIVKTSDASDLEDLRFVMATRLHVRESCNKRARIIDTLSLGKTVRVLERAGQWRLVEYLDPDGVELRQGWVFAKFLKNFDQ